MFKGLHVGVVMPAYNAEKTVTQTYQDVLAQEIVDTIILVDDSSSDKTVEVAKGLDQVTVLEHSVNMGYGANQKTCYKAALEAGADIIIMVHPDYQYTPKLIPAMTGLIGNGLFSCVLGSRILGGNAVRDGMPLYKYIANRLLTFVENVFTGAKLSEYHTGYRAFSRQLLEQIDLSSNSDDFVFDNQMLLQIIWTGENVGEVSCPTKYFAEASSINFSRSVRYGLGCLATAVQFRLAKMNVLRSQIFTHKL
ncbi:MAG: glycosyltransferase family 2 protein [Candidatus Electrothrix sp. AR4]|nr:glycosyltransferase family 2 protein [Candidatus Electrothrix sp. AR4]